MQQTQTLLLSGKPPLVPRLAPANRLTALYAAADHDGLPLEVKQGIWQQLAMVDGEAGRDLVLQRWGQAAEGRPTSPVPATPHGLSLTSSSRSDERRSTARGRRSYGQPLAEFRASCEPCTGFLPGLHDEAPLDVLDVPGRPSGVLRRRHLCSVAKSTAQGSHIVAGIRIGGR